MTDEKATNAEPRSPYDLWPDGAPEPERAEAQMIPEPAEMPFEDDEFRDDAAEWQELTSHASVESATPGNNATEWQEPAAQTPVTPDEWANGSVETAPEPTGWAYPEPDQTSAPTEPAAFDAPFEAKFVPVAYTPETPDENIRRSGLAWSAGVVFFGSVAFMLLLGWLADLLLGSAPWGLVGGIILGAIIGFLQFFRISSQIFSSSNKGPEARPLMGPRDEDS